MKPSRKKHYVAFLAAVAALFVTSVAVVPMGAQADSSPSTNYVSEQKSAEQIALEQAQSSGEVVPVWSDFTRRVSVNALPTGLLQADIAAGPVQEPDPSNPGRWVPIDTSLSKVGGAIVPAVSDASISLSAGGDGSLASVSYGGRTLRFDIPNATLPAPSLSGDTATYPNIEPNTDLAVKVLPDGIEVSLVIKAAPPGTPTLNLRMSSTNTEVASGDSGGLVFTDGQGREISESDAPILFVGSPSDGPAPGALQQKVPAQVADTGTDQLITVAPDPSFFHQKGISYPVTLDPVVDFSAGKDTYINSNLTNTSYGTSTDLKVGYNGTAVTRTFVRFQGVETTLAGTQVSDAHVLLYETGADSSCASTEADIMNLTSSFSDNTTWATRPSVDPDVVGSASSNAGCNGSHPSAQVDFSTGAQGTVAGLVQDWIDGAKTNYGIEVAAANEGATSSWKMFQSSEAAHNVPDLQVTYSQVWESSGDELLTPSEVFLSTQQPRQPSGQAPSPTAADHPQLAPQDDQASYRAPDETVDVAAGSAGSGSIKLQADGPPYNYWWPADPTLAVGATQGMFGINDSYGSFDKATGALVRPLDSLQDLFNVPGWSYVTDPNFTYDLSAPSDPRFYAVAFGRSSSTSNYKLLVAASTQDDSGNPGPNWCVLPPFTVASTGMPDFPKIAAGPNGIFVTVDVFSADASTFLGAELFSIAKSPFDSCSTVNVHHNFKLHEAGSTSLAFAVMPAAYSEGGPAAEWMADMLPGKRSTATLWKVSGSVTNPNGPTLKNWSVGVPTAYVPPAPQIPNGGTLNIVGQDEFTGAYYSNGWLYADQTSKNPTTGRAEARLVRIRTTSPFDGHATAFSNGSRDVFYPAATESGCTGGFGRTVVFTESGSSMAPAMARASLVNGTWTSPPDVLMAGSGSEPSNMRWGDYAGASPDPSCATPWVWLFSEYGNGSSSSYSFATRVVAVG